MVLNYCRPLSLSEIRLVSVTYMQPIHTRFGDAMSILVTVLGLMIVVAASVALIVISLKLARLIFSFVSVSWGKSISFLTILLIVYGLALVVGKYLLDAELLPD